MTIIWLPLHFQIRYKKWSEDNYSSTDRMNISWLPFCALGFLCITVAYCFIVIYASLIWYIIHSIVIIIFFTYLFYKGLFHENPYPEGFFRNTLDEEIAEKTNDYPSLHNIEETPQTAKEDTVFSEKLPYYKEVVEKWMETSQPYLRVDFKLLDVAEVLPLNRTYLSRVFNESFGSSFSAVVQQYRLEEGRRLLLEHPDISVTQISHLAGFSSSSTFHHAFSKKMGMSPHAYRRKQRKT